MQMMKQKLDYLSQMFAQEANCYKLILDFAKHMPPIDPKYKIDNYKVEGCQSKTYIYGEPDSEGVMYFSGYSDALITRGLVAIILYMYNSSTAESILKEGGEFLSQLPLKKNLSLARSQGIYQILNKVRKISLYSILSNQDSLHQN